MKKNVRLTMALLAGAWIATAGLASASLQTQKRAKEAGFPAQSCLYCHGEKLPKKGASTMNDRGKWLAAQKEGKKAKEVDPAWLKDYEEPKDKK